MDRRTSRVTKPAGRTFFRISKFTLLLQNINLSHTITVVKNVKLVCFSVNKNVHSQKETAAFKWKKWANGGHLIDQRLNGLTLPFISPLTE